MSWSAALELVAVLATVGVLAPITWLFVRRRWLSSRGSVFECAMRANPDDSSAAWMLGLARYVGDTIECYRIFSLSLRPLLVLRRGRMQFRGRRSPDANERTVLFSDHHVVLLEQWGPKGARHWELAMPAESITGLLSWLEAAPPRGDAYTRD